MLPPSRFLLAFRPTATPALLVAASSIALHFSATPFLIPVIAERYGTALGTSGYISVAQVGGFTLVTLLAGRRFQPKRELLVAAAIIGVVANAGSALVTTFLGLLGLRALAGLAAGMITWLAWSEAMRDRMALRDVAGVGPLTALIGTPVIAWLLTIADDRVVFLALAASCLPAALMRTSFDDTPLPRRRKMSPSRSNVVLLVALGILTGAGSSLFIYAASIGQEQNALSPVVTSLAFSLNAAAGLAATRLRAGPRSSPIWLGLTCLSAAGVAFVDSAAVFYVAMLLWGFSFWMAVPVVLAAVAHWSLVPEERTGDAQGIMALGRAVGPALGGALLGIGSYAAVGFGATAGLATSAGLVALVDRYRARHPERRPIAGHRVAARRQTRGRR